MLGTDVAGGVGLAADVEAGPGVLVGLGVGVGTLELVVLAFPVDALVGGPERFHHLDGLVHDFVALVVAVGDAVAGEFARIASGDQVDVDAALGELVEGADHAGHLGGKDVARPGRDQHLQPGRPGRHHCGRDPGFPAGRGDGDEGVLEAGRFGGQGDALEHLHGGGDELVGVGEVGQVAVCGDVPAEADGGVGHRIFQVSGNVRSVGQAGARRTEGGRLSPQEKKQRRKKETFGATGDRCPPRGILHPGV